MLTVLNSVTTSGEFTTSGKMSLSLDHHRTSITSGKFAKGRQVVIQRQGRFTTCSVKGV